jgi:hypothetical protein
MPQSAALRLVLTDKSVAALPYTAGQYIARDEHLRGFFVTVGSRAKTYYAQGDLWLGARRRTVKVKIGRVEDISAREARAEAKAQLAAIAKGRPPEGAVAAPKADRGPTLREAWARYRDIHMERRGRSPATVANYRDHVERMLRDWLDYPLMTLGENPRMVAERHDRMSRDNGPYGANGAMRTLRAIYNHARKTCRALPADNTTLGVDWNVDRRRDTAMGASDLPRWFTEAGRLRHPIRREFHLFMLLSGSRPGALLVAKVEHLHVGKRLLHIPKPKGGAAKAFDVPLSRAMVRCLVRAMRASRQLHPTAARTWIFAADSGVGHMVERDEKRSQLFKWGNDLRQSYRTLGQACGLSEIDMHLMMNHAIPGVNAGYITRAKLLSNHLLTAQEKLSRFIIDMGRARRRNEPPPERMWPLLPSRKIGDPILDPTPPDPRIGQHFGGRRKVEGKAPTPPPPMAKFTSEDDWDVDIRRTARGARSI